ncbi:MAG: SUMF1/EgtB/PvdO family nonheme iron enzyme [Rubripirellula sp.]|nr:SUMF1/EgtB/PvdO family nonheme iron enzyme [Rubripirellula sp.]
MNGSNFDPYHKWLGIPPKAQPPNHYRLLSVELFESDPDVIESAAQRQITHVRSFALGQHAEETQSILNELAKARATLLDPATKAKYDASLNAQRQQPAVVPSPPAAADDVMQAVPFDIPTAQVAPRKTSSPKNRRQPSSKLIPLVAGFVVALLVIATIGWLFSDSKQPLMAEIPVSEQPSKEVQAVEVESEVQPVQPPSGLGSIQDSAKPSLGGNAEAMDQESVDATEAQINPETTSPPATEEASTETVVVSSERSDATTTPAPAIVPFDSKQAKAHQEAWAAHLGLDVEVTNSIGMKLRVIPPGTFMMGSEDGQNHEEPVHQVTLTKPILLGVHEVTQAEYQTVMGVNPSEFKGLQNPVEKVSWNDASEFCRSLSSLSGEKRAGRVYRLPTEAEWEFVCRAGTTTTYSFGDDESLLSRYAWSKDSSDLKTHRVATKLTNPFGLSDLHGNVWEWCQDWYGDYPDGSVTNPIGASGASRVLRGGSWAFTAVDCRSAYRGRGGPLFRSSSSGFRVACVPSATASTEIAASPPMKSGEEVESDAVAPPNIPEPANGGPAPAVAPFDSGQAKKHQEAWAKHLKVDVEVTNSIGMTLRVIPAGTFRMGEGKTVHDVTLTTPFLLGVHEVTQDQYEKVMRVNPSQFKDSRNPVETVTWMDANEFCRRLSLLPREKRAGWIYRLPTEAEWEFACRAGTTTTYSFGDDESLLGRYAWTEDNSDRKTHPVGTKLANSFGLNDMHGNVWEWCQDWYGDYPSVAVTDPKGATSGLGRVYRGGSWYFKAGRCRSSARVSNHPADRSNILGFRVVIVPSSLSSD